ncbi:MAG: 50S ribosomal protein L20 [Candidatus Terrybacteria bacterium RIFCSPLOWO2_01_FULL_44_24]|uniref:Large ribosomal subunit protein bL20 n=1 Tax=Candidatus Terrybacteria bacterium RIFCSPHIGHO2_01_FULL_43_35 TaxID=1802361 RepID=A0A1G2PE58_9BACT|nr:MAG: 50S ribosomal protein L20 [Candidatus Terrybacteria bacterium RIFCSPHIGHO2_01_FULL_43_35]OHA50855.1 MAG: 50S ribosomal protein L20 [Candidatus Terrybacteria bacterium RIFCSPLOWO2_01_FULL_44_24]
MSRVKRGKTRNAKRGRLLKQTKGFRWGRKSKKLAAKQALMKAWSYSTRDRKRRKGEFRKLWQIRINAASRQNGLSYSQLMNLIHKKNVALDRKILSEIAEKYPDVFKSIVEEIRK